MRNLSIPTFEPIDSGFDGIRYYAMIYYPNGKRDSRFWLISLYSIGGKGETFATADAYLARKAQLTQWSLI